MCLEDIRIQRKTTSSERTVTVTNASQMIASPSRDRTSLVISSPNTNDIYVSITPPASATNGMRINAGQTPLMLSLFQHGDLVTKGFYAISPDGDEVITVWETSFEDNENP